MSTEIWDEFEKLAITQGLISVGEDEEESYDADAEVSRAKTRVNSLSDDAVRLLYGLKPESIYDTKKSMVEVAHPETFIVGPAYDSMNAVIENGHERQNMMTYIALKTPNGHLTQRRYVAAKQELMNSLVRAAFMLDNRDETELMSFADSCAVRADQKSEQIIKEAFPFIAIGAVAALLGLVYYFGYGSTSIQNVYVNSKKVLEALHPLSSQSYASGIETDVSHLMDMAGQVYALKNEIGQVDSVDAVIDIAKQAQHAAKMQEITTKINAYIAQLNKITNAIPGWVGKIQTVHSTSTEEKSNFWSKITEVTNHFYWDNWQTLIDALQGQGNLVDTGKSGGLLGAIEKEIKIMNATKTAAHEAIQNHPDVQKAVDKTAPPTSAQTPHPAPDAAPAPTQPEAVARIQGSSW